MQSFTFYKKNREEENNSRIRETNEEKTVSGIKGLRCEQVPTDLIIPNPSQPRMDFGDESIIRLADSIRQYGMIQPLSVRILGEDNPNGIVMYELVAGERRLRAAKMLRLSEVPCIIVSYDSARSAEAALIENIQREELNPFEIAQAISKLGEIHALSREQIAKKLSCSQSYIANKLRLLRLTLNERELIIKNGLTERHARALLKIDDTKSRIAIIEYIIKHGLNVAECEKYIDRYLMRPEKQSEDRKSKIVMRDLRLFYNTLDRAVGTMRTAGIEVESERFVKDDTIEILIKIAR